MIYKIIKIPGFYFQKSRENSGFDFRNGYFDNALWVRLNVKWKIGICLPCPSFLAVQNSSIGDIVTH